MGKAIKLTRTILKGVNKDSLIHLGEISRKCFDLMKIVEVMGASVRSRTRSVGLIQFSSTKATSPVFQHMQMVGF